MRINACSLFSAGLLLVGGCSDASRLRIERVLTPQQMAASIVPATEAMTCARCHQPEYEAWQKSQHAFANRLAGETSDAAAFEPRRMVKHGWAKTTMERKRRDFFFTTSFSNGEPSVYRAEAVIGISPLRQYLVAFPGGRLQTMDIAFDPRSNEWFYAFADEREPGEWGHWTGRSMTWNSQCAFCHTTGFEKKYDARADAYSSTWKAMGVSCSQCHQVGEQKFDPNHCPVTNRPGFVKPVTGYVDTCASCHARREELTGAFKAGESFDEHYRLALPDQPGIYFADGQVRDEDFEYGSFRMSRMAHKGVTCLNCHDPHSGGLRLPLENNAICMQCHVAPGLNGALPIDPEKHSFHKPGTAGSLCVDCHMPITHYMQRDPRRDHGFTKPDPALTREWGIPNACNRCHTTQTVAWAEGLVDEWYGSKMESLTRHRARLVARVSQGDGSVVTSLLAFAASEEITAWRSVLTGLLAPWNQRQDVRAFLEKTLSDPEPLVRSAAIRALAGAPDTHVALLPLRRDTSRLVRLDAAFATANPLEQDGVNAAEVTAYLKAVCDQPAGAIRNAEYSSNLGRKSDAEFWAHRAAALDSSAIPRHLLGQILYRNDKLAEAISAFEEAARLDGNNADFSFTLALARAEAGDHAGALRDLKEAVRRDPSFGRAWYNLGLAASSQGDLDSATNFLARAEELLTESADPPYARATVLMRKGDVQGAVAAAKEALARDPAHLEARRLITAQEGR